MTDLSPGDRVVFKALGKQHVGIVSYDKPSLSDHVIVVVDETRGRGATLKHRHVVPRSGVVKW
jgi:hypothetical protein